MKPLVDPAADDITVQGILHALADPVRVHIFAGIAQADCAQTCSAFLEVSDRVLPRSTLSQHFRVLRDAGLIRSERVGVQMHNTPRCAEIDARFPGLVDAIINAHRLQTQRERQRQRAQRQRDRRAAPAAT